MAANPIDLWVQKYCAAVSEQEKFKVVEWVITQEIFGKVSEMRKTSQRLTTRVSAKAAFCAILNELDNRWRQFAKRVNAMKGIEEIKPDGFARFIQNRQPDAFLLWMLTRKEIGLPPL